MYQLLDIVLTTKTPEITHIVDLGFKIGDDEELHHVKLGLFGNETPKTVQNFVMISKMHRENKESTNMGYEHTISHRLIKNFMIQFGDFNHHDGTGGYSIYGATFNDENFNVKFQNRKHLLAMANRGKNTNSAQCFITFTQTPWLENGYVVFGVALKESQQTLDLLENVQTDRRDRPLKDVEIYTVTVEEVKEPFTVDFEV